MTGMLDTTVDLHYDVVKKWATKSTAERNAGINQLIDEILSGDLPYDTLEIKKQEAKILAEMVLRNAKCRDIN